MFQSILAILFILKLVKSSKFYAPKMSFISSFLKLVKPFSVLIIDGAPSAQQKHCQSLKADVR